MVRDEDTVLGKDAEPRVVRGMGLSAEPGLVWPNKVEEDAMYYYQCPCGDMFELSEVCARCLSHHCALATRGCFFPLRSGAS